MGNERRPADGDAWALIPLPENMSEEQVRVRLNKFPYKVGRCTPCDLVVPCKHVSKLHAMFIVKGRTLYLHDQGSTNGSYVNGVNCRDSCELQRDDVLQFGSCEYRLTRQADILPTDTISAECAAVFRNTLEFRQILKDRAIIPAFQAVVNPFSATAIGYEVLVRSTRDGLRGAADLFFAATRVGMECELSELSRIIGMTHARFLPNNAIRFLNTHPLEMAGSNLLPSLVKLRENDPQAPIVLEIHESSICNPMMIREFSRELQKLDIGLAYDDFGQGQSRILELIEAPSDFLKFDLELIRGIDRAPKSRQKLLASLVHLAKDVGTMSIAEGVETLAELEACKQLGFDLVQGYYYGRPQPIEWIVADIVDVKANAESIAVKASHTNLQTIEC